MPASTRRPSPTGSPAEFRAMAATLRHFERRLHPHHGAAAQGGLRGALAPAGRSPATSISGHYEGWYAVRDEAFYDEDELTTNVRRRPVAPTGRAGGMGARAFSYFFRLSAWQDRLLAFYEAQPGLHRARTPGATRCISFVRGGLNDLSVSRTSFRWGVPVPGDPDHVMYVWLDALTNYITAAGYPGRERRRAGASGPPICTWSARTSSASTPSTGRPS